MRRMMKPIQLLALLLVPLARIGLAQPGGVVADPSVAQLPLASLQGMPPAALWDELDGAEFWGVPRDPPPDYYDSADLSSTSGLRAWLHNRIAGHTVYPYTHSSRPDQAKHSVDVWDIVALADAHPESPDRVLDLYLNGSFDRQLAGTNRNPRYDREHGWPKSLGFPDQDPLNAAYSDCHHLFAAYQSYNASRSNKPYGGGDPDAEARRTTLESTGGGGSLMDEPESSNYSFREAWQTWLGRRGDTARAMFYMDVRYDGRTNEPDLVLTADAGQISMRNVWRTGGRAFMGLLPALLEWHTQDPVDDLERRRNAVVFLFQGNRNPFIDHPEWVGPIFAGEPFPTAGPGPGSPAAPAGVLWINEFHYDNQGQDEGEFVEVCGPAGTDLSGWLIVCYNGNGGRLYEEVELSGVLGNGADGFGIAAFDVEGIQNGSPDGLALVDPSGRVVEIIGYEGRFTAADGPATGGLALDIGVEESPTTPVGSSLQRRGQGRSGPDFQWEGPLPASRGGVNSGQTFR